MTRLPPRRLLALALVPALSATAFPAPAQTASPFALPAPAATAPILPGTFTVSDIRVDGLQRISAGTVFTYLPVERGDRLDRARAAEAIRALYKTGFFEDVRLDRQGDILVVTVVERPAINKLTLVGNKDIKTDDLLKGLADIGLAEGETFDRMNLDRVTQELIRQYNNRGKYNVVITPAVARLDRNRVDVTIDVKEGKAANIRHINLIGNEKFDQELITDNWESRESNWMSWYRRDDQYSREKLSGDLEKLNAFYLDRGYVDFSLDSTQVEISPDKRDMFISAGLSEGEQYKLSKVELTGDTVLPKAEVEKRVIVKPGQVFSRRLLDLTSDAISLTLSNIGYAFAKVDVLPEVDRAERTVGITLNVIPGPRVTIRRVEFKGNTRTSDEVLRREMRQFEGSWYAQAAIDRSKVRLQRLGYFETVDVENVPVPGSNDQVDVVYTVKETTSGSFMFGVGYSQLSGVTTSVQLSENNFLGTGNRMSVAAQRSYYQKRYDFSFINPYFTDEGMSLGYNLWWREFDYSNFNVAQYSTNSGAAQLVMGLPITEWDSVSALFGIDSNEILAFRGSSPDEIVDYIDAIGNRTFHTWRGQLAWARDTRNDYFMPSVGSYQRISAEVALPGSTAEYYKLEYEYSRYWPLSPALILRTGVNLGYGDSYGDAVTRDLCYTPPTPPTTGNPNPPPPPPPSDPCIAGTSPDYVKTVTADGLPFFENFYAGGISSGGRVRGFVDNTLGPRAASAFGFSRPVGGSVKTVGSLELFFPRLFDTKAARISAFLDFGNVYRDWADFDAGLLRASTGVALLWRSPMGPISISYAIPLRTEPFDETERLQFSFGGQF
ncbi:outer membrane protein assembly factor BamA [Cognatiluteimonas weifangensis]|uniref:Outer membrane protein assembly factor BamA n=1 Tax=Cognatiluteimonas weifangensis TaxID=2303539 RepID=A0A372DRT8_9GAMM|nr:outer membrane protein assembly factor BamA [Luteimonas weifangensis]RFP62265.1 outer membrane protein assembly factor BamA [Luteimonas weifangensis]